MKKITSLLLSLLMLLSITASIDLSAFAATALFAPVQINSISTKNAFDAGYWNISERGTNMAPSKGKYIVDDYADQFVYFEQYCTINEMKDWENKKQSANVGDEIYDNFAKKIGIVDNNMKPIGTEYQRTARIYYYIDKTWKYAREGVGSAPYGMIFREGRCETMAIAFQELATRANLNCYIVRSDNLNHAWNLVKIENEYYTCDTCHVVNGYKFGAGSNSKNDIITNENRKNVSNPDYDAVALSGNLNNKDYQSTTANGAFSQFEKDNKLSTKDYAVPTETIKNVKITTTVTATEAGTVVKWNPVSGADWYDVYYATFDGYTTDAARMNIITGDLTPYPTKPYVYAENNEVKYFSKFTTVHSVDKNEKGQYQTFIDGSKSNGKYVAVCIVAHSVNGWASGITNDYGQMKTTDAFASMGYDYEEDALVTQVKMGQGLKYGEFYLAPYVKSNMAETKNYKANHTHSFTSKPVVVARKAIVGAQGAEVYECTKCLAREMRYTDALKAPAGHTHNYVYTVVTPSTCYSEGVAVYKCSCSAERETKTIPASHSWDKGTVTKKATCTANGTKKYTCSKCKSTKTETIKATGHKYDAGKVTKTATCKAEGVKTYTCSTCNQTKTEKIAKLAHTYKTTSTSKATTKANGSITKKCSACGATTKTTIYYPKTITLSTTSYTYDGKVKKPSVTVKDSKGNKIAASNYTVTYASGRKNVGTYKVTIKFKGNYSGTVTKTFTIKPKATTLSSVTAGKKKFTVKWKKQATQTTGYEIQYSTSSKFTNAKTVTVSKNSTTSKSISKLTAKKKYYVRIRTYKTVKVNGKSTKIYSAWSKSKAVTTKK